MSELGNLPPQAIDVEEAVLGAVLLERDAYVMICNIISKDTFYSDKNRIVYEACQSLNDNGDPIDILTVSNHLKSKRRLSTVGGMPYLARITARIASAANLEKHALIIQEKFTLRQIAKYSSELNRIAYSGDLDDAFSNMTTGVEDIIKETFRQSNLSTFNDATKKFLEDVHENYSKRKDGIQTGITTGFKDFDKHSGGFQDSDLTILAARPGMGKTAVAVKIAVEAAKSGNNVLFFSLEMATNQLVQRAVSGECDISYRKMRTGDLTQDELNDIVSGSDNIKTLPLFVDDKAGATIEYISATAKQKKLKNEVDMIIVDYLQLIGTTGKHGSREQEVSHIARTLKLLAKEISIPVIALSQLNRGVDERPDHRPKLSDLRESGAIEQDSDNVIFLLRPWYYSKLDEDDGKIHILLEKHRSGGTGDFTVMHNEAITIFWGETEHKPSINYGISYEKSGKDKAIAEEPEPIKENTRFEDEEPF